MLALTTKRRIKEKLINDAVNDLKRWIFPMVNNRNIFTDITYSYFFERILYKKRGLNKDIDLVVDELLFELTYTPKN